MSLNEQEPPAKCMKLDTHTNSLVNEPAKQPSRQNSYALEVSRRQYLNARSADVFFTFENSEKRIPAHRSVLSAASAVFDSMFYGPMAVNGDVPLPGKSPELFEGFLQFCYLGEVVLKPNNITEIMSLLHEYQMNEGLVVCGRFLADNWTIENICSMYDWAINLQIGELQAFCAHKIRAHSDKIFKTDGFLVCSFDALDRTLELQSLNCDESAVLIACLAWARYKCQQSGKDSNDMKNLREFLIKDNVNLLYKIRYGSITHEEFLSCYDVNNGIFEDAGEREDMMRLLLGAKHSNTGKFLTEHRKIKWNEKLSLECDVLIKEQPFGREICKDSRDTITTVIEVNDFIFLAGFYNAQICKGRGWYPNEIIFNFSIKERPMNIDETPKEFYKKRFNFISNKETYFHFDEGAILLRPGIEYHLEFQNELDIQYYRYKINKKIKFNDRISIDLKAGDDQDCFISKLKLSSPY